MRFRVTVRGTDGTALYPVDAPDADAARRIVEARLQDDDRIETAAYVTDQGEIVIVIPRRAGQVHRFLMRRPEVDALVAWWHTAGAPEPATFPGGLSLYKCDILDIARPA